MRKFYAADYSKMEALVSAEVAEEIRTRYLESYPRLADYVERSRGVSYHIEPKGALFELYRDGELVQVNSDLVDLIKLTRGEL